MAKALGGKGKGAKGRRAGAGPLITSQPDWSKWQQGRGIADYWVRFLFCEVSKSQRSLASKYGYIHITESESHSLVSDSL